MSILTPWKSPPVHMVIGETWLVNPVQASLVSRSLRTLIAAPITLGVIFLLLAAFGRPAFDAAYARSTIEGAVLHLGTLVAVALTVCALAKTVQRALVVIVENTRDLDALEAVAPNDLYAANAVAVWEACGAAEQYRASNIEFQRLRHMKVRTAEEVTRTAELADTVDRLSAQVQDIIRAGMRR